MIRFYIHTIQNQYKTKLETNMPDIILALKKLLEEKRIFGSEADFQFALAWKIKELFPKVEIRLEYIPWKVDASMHIDIVVFSEGKMIPIELKYKPKLTKIMIEDEEIYLKNQSACDQGRYDFLKDIQRMESFKASGYPVKEAYVIIMTNDSGYWRKSKRSDTDDPPNDEEFRIHEGGVISGERHWKVKAGVGSTKDRKKPIIFKNSYQINWKDYQPAENCLFKYVLLKI